MAKNWSDYLNLRSLNVTEVRYAPSGCKTLAKTSSVLLSNLIMKYEISYELNSISIWYNSILKQLIMFTITAKRYATTQQTFRCVQPVIISASIGISARIVTTVKPCISSITLPRSSFQYSCHFGVRYNLRFHKQS